MVKCIRSIPPCALESAIVAITPRNLSGHFPVFPPDTTEACMQIQRKPDVPSSEITPRHIYMDRRRFMRDTSLAVGGIGLFGGLFPSARGATDNTGLGPLEPSPFSTDEALTRKMAATGYNNFYEFGTDNEDPSD